MLCTWKTTQQKFCTTRSKQQRLLQTSMAHRTLTLLNRVFSNADSPLRLQKMFLTLEKKCRAVHTCTQTFSATSFLIHFFFPQNIFFFTLLAFYCTANYSCGSSPSENIHLFHTKNNIKYEEVNFQVPSV